MKLDRREFLALSAAPAIIGTVSSAALRPEDFGARGDGITNDTDAFARLAKEVNRRGTGTIALRPGRTYVVGAQQRGPSGWLSQPILELSNLKGPLALHGNGARLIAQPGLRFGTFDLETGEPVHHPMPYLNRTDLAGAYLGMIVVRNCNAPVTIRDIELDGNIAKFRIGGRFGDTGWQIPATGLLLTGNRAEELIENIYSHHHGQDGAMFIGDPNRVGRGRVERLISRYNGRQGLSLTSGRGYDFLDCEFSHSARGVIKSAPGAGVDVEAEAAPVEDISFTRCRFVDNSGCGMVADSGQTSDLRFSECHFVGTTNWSAWPNKPSCTFDRCTFVGSVVHAYPNANPRRAAKFTECYFTDDPKLSPSGKVYTPGGPIVNLAQSDNVLFDRCTFRLIGSGTLPWSWKATYRSCAMNQKSHQSANPKGRYLGSTTITGPVDLYGSMVEGAVVLNGKQIPKGPQGVPSW